MDHTLRPCPACARHVRHAESACPFCAAALAPMGPEPARVEGARLSRAAMLLLGSAALLEGCPAPAAVYGGPPPTIVDAAAPRATVDAPPPPRSPLENIGSTAGIYGAPPPRTPGDAGR